jgi:ATP-binding cassette, subfamily B, bacterial PglK
MSAIEPIVQKNQTVRTLMMRLWSHITPRRRKQFSLLFVLMIITSFIEVFSIGMVLPFIGALTAPEQIFVDPNISPFIIYIGLSSAEQLLLPMTVLFCLASFISGGVRLLLLWVNVKLSFATGADLSINVYRKTLYQPYTTHISRNSSDIINSVTRKTEGVIFYAIMPILTIASGAIMLTSILILLLAIDVGVAIMTFAGFGIIYAMIITFTRSKMEENSNIQAKETTRVIKSLQEGLGGIRDILIDGTQEAYCTIYRDADLPLRRSQGNTQIIAQTPRYGMETLGMVFIALLAYTLARQQGGVHDALPVLGALALGSQRLLPVVQQGYVAWTSFQSGRVSLQDALELLDQKLPEYAVKKNYNNEKITFEKKIDLNDISFRYNLHMPWVLQNLDLSVNKGERVGFVGTTGCGKSTLLDVIMGLLQPDNGSIKVDGQPITMINTHAWQKHIAHVPQNIFLSDATIEENIAFGKPSEEINRERIHRVAHQAKIANSIESWPLKYQTNVGERGISLSGGQRQRIGIARALYKEANVIIFDEATSALDIETEEEIISSIDDLSKELTIFVIAHRITTLKNCTKIVELNNGKISWSGTYMDLEKKGSTK